MRILCVLKLNWDEDGDGDRDRDREGSEYWSKESKVIKVLSILRTYKYVYFNRISI